MLAKPRDEQTASPAAGDDFEAGAGRHAVVIGGGIAGLLAARVLAHHFDRVSVIERDYFPAGPDARQGVPQSRHAHVLLERGLLILQELFPGIREELIAAGAPQYDSADFAWFTPAGWAVRFRGMTRLSFTRGLLELGVRRRLAAFDNVRFLCGLDVAGLILNGDNDGDNSRVAGVCLRPFREKADGPCAGVALLAEVVVDASGRGSRTPGWLRDLGYKPPPETVVSAFLGYASRLYKIPGREPGWKAAFLQAAPPNRTRGGLLFPVEGGRWLVTAAGGDRDYPPTDEAGFLGFFRSLPSPIIYDAIKDAEPLTPVFGSRATENRRRHYDKLARLPEGLLLVGDSVCAFNPVYGQGMTVAALEAALLDTCLRQQRGRRPDGSLAGLTRTFQQRLARVTAAPWLLATGEDYRYRGTVGAPAPRVVKLMHRYLDQVVTLGTESAEMRRLWVEVAHMLRPGTTLLRPPILLRVLRRSLRSRTGLVAQDPAGFKLPETA